MNEARSIEPSGNWLAEILVRYEKPLLKHAYGICSDRELSRDAVQETFFRLIRTRDKGMPENLAAWLFTVCRNRALDVLRKDKRVQQLEDVQWQKVAGPDLQPDEQLERDERFSRLEIYLRRLSENQREVIILKFQHDLSYQEIHEVTGLTTGNIGFLIHTGIKRLRDLMPDDLRP